MAEVYKTMTRIKDFGQASRQVACAWVLHVKGLGRCCIVVDESIDESLLVALTVTFIV